MNDAEPTPESLALELHEADFASQGSVANALNLLTGATPHPRHTLLRHQLAAEKRACWTAVAAAMGNESPPDAAGIWELMVWEVDQAFELSPEALGTMLDYGAERLTVAELLQLNARRSLWYAGQLASLTRVHHA